MGTTTPPSFDLETSFHRVVQRTSITLALGACVGLLWGLNRGATSAKLFYAVGVGSNCALVALPCFAAKEVFDVYVKPPVLASALAGSFGGGIMFAVYAASVKSSPKAFVTFGLVGATTQLAGDAFDLWRIKKRDEIIAERSKK